MKRKWLAIALSMALAVGMLSGCGDNKETTSAAPANNTETEAPDDGGETEAPAVETVEDGGGKVLNIYIWNDEFQSRFEQYYPDYDKKTKMIGDVKVNFIENVNEGSNYQDKLDEALAKQESADADSKVDIFLAEADYIAKYTSAAADVALDVKALGLTDEDMAQMYDYTKQAATDEYGAVKGLSWQASGSGMFYRRSLAKEYFGTDDPAAVQEQVADWDKFKAAAETVKTKSKGKVFMLSGPNDMFRIFQNNDTTKYVDGDKLVFTPGLEKWTDTMKEYMDAGYIQNANNALWTEDWGKGMSLDGGVFCYFGPAWFINFCLGGYTGAAQDDEGNFKHKDGKDSYGDWAMCAGPESFNWGGTWIIGAKGTDNAALVKDIMLKMTCDQTILYNIAKDKQDYVNGKEACDKLIADGVTSPILGDQNMIEVLKPICENISMTNVTGYDQQCIEQAQTVFADFFAGKSDKQTCTDKWMDEVIKKFPNLSK